MSEQTTSHHPDCDGFYYRHPANIEQVSRAGRGLWQGVCQKCNWRGSLVGPDAKVLASQQVGMHDGGFATCDGRCLAWED